MEGCLGVRLPTPTPAHSGWRNCMLTARWGLETRSSKPSPRPRTAHLSLISIYSGGLTVTTRTAPAPAPSSSPCEHGRSPACARIPFAGFCVSLESFAELSILLLGGPKYSLEFYNFKATLAICGLATRMQS